LLQETTTTDLTGKSAKTLAARVRARIMQANRPLRLGTRLSIYITFALVIILSIYALDMLGKRRMNLIDRMKDETLTVGTALALPLEEAVRDREFERLQRLIDASSQIGEIYALYLADARGAVRVQTRGAADVVDPGPVREALLYDRNDDRFLTVNGIPIYVLYLPVHISEDEVAGVLIVARSLGALQLELEHLQQSILAAVLALLTIILLGSMLLIRQSVTNPVNQLVQAIFEIGAGKYRYRTPISKAAGREIVELAAAIEHMGRRLEEEHQQLEEETAKRVTLETRLRQADKLATLGQIAAGLAHEIGTPLNIIGGRADMALRRVAEPEKVSEHLRTIQSQVDRITETVQRLLNVARRQDRQRGRVNLVELLRESIAMLDPTAQHAGVALRFQATAKGEVQGDGELIQQVFTNLIVNAIHASPAGTQIEIVLQPVTAAPAGLDLLARPYVEITISDQGKGIAPELRQRIFEPFFTTKPPGSGTGLGLAICAGIVKEHEGFIRVGENTGGGARFSVFLPADGEAAAMGVSV
jgi:signal transduction histidine kinase